MRDRDLDSGFEDYRRERTRRRLNAGQPLRDLGNQANVLRELELAEAAEIQDQRLSREVAEFFEEATRTAAAIVKRVAETEELAATERISDEMQEFLMDAIRRMGMFVEVLKQTGGADGEKNLETHMQNLVGPMLDSFRLEGTAQLENQHLGEDPFDTEIGELSSDRDEDSLDFVEPVPVYPDPTTEGSEDLPEIEKIPHVVDHGEAPRRIPEHDLAPEKIIEMDADAGEEDDEPEEPEETRAPAPHPLLVGIMEDEAKLKNALRLLVSGGLMSKEEARKIFRSRPTS